MRKILLIIRREYLSRVKNKTFIFLTLLGPLLYVLMFTAPVLIATMDSEQRYKVIVVDESGKFAGMQDPSGEVAFQYAEGLMDENLRMELLENTDAEMILHIPPFEKNDLDSVEIISAKNLGIGITNHIKDLLSDELKERRMAALGIGRETIESISARVKIRCRVVGEAGLRESSVAAASGAAFGGGFLIYFFIFLYGGLVLKGVQEEKSNRIVEIIISSVKPFQLMLGKILGIAMVGLTQFAFWIILTVLLTSIASLLFMPDPGSMTLAGDSGMAQGPEGAEMFQNIMASIDTLPLGLLLFSFGFYFLFGYLLYSSLFASFAAAVDSQSDTYQFMFPASVPLLFSIMTLPALINNPDSGLAFWLSMIPFTSPVIMMARIPFEVPAWQLLLSMGLMVAGFLGTTWLAGRIYRAGILMYGKKASLKEMGRWIAGSR
ncbi:MAG: ABC transporter permease [Bacteroidia bacterium]